MGQPQDDPDESQKENGPRQDDDQPNERFSRVAVRPREIMTRLPEEACCRCNDEGRDHQDVAGHGPGGGSLVGDLGRQECAPDEDPDRRRA